MIPPPNPVVKQTDYPQNKQYKWHVLSARLSLLSVILCIYLRGSEQIQSDETEPREQIDSQVKYLSMNKLSLKISMALRVNLYHV